MHQTIVSFLLVLLSSFSGSSSQRNEPPVVKVTILVFDRATGTGVQSKVFLLAQGKEDDVGPTSPDGMLVLDHVCQLGERFRAEANDASYYYSNESRCDNKVQLSLRKREKPINWREERTLTIRHQDGKTRTITLEWALDVRIRSTKIDAFYCEFRAEGEISRVVGEVIDHRWRQEDSITGLPSIEARDVKTDFCTQRGPAEKESRDRVVSQFQEFVQRDLTHIREELLLQGYDVL
jgi:hypothetical protein